VWVPCMKGRTKKNPSRLCRSRERPGAPSAPPLASPPSHASLPSPLPEGTVGKRPSASAAAGGGGGLLPPCAAVVARATTADWGHGSRCEEQRRGGSDLLRAGRSAWRRRGGCAMMGRFRAGHGERAVRWAQGVFLAAIVGVDRGGAALDGCRQRREGAPTEVPWRLGLASPDLGPSGLNLGRTGPGRNSCLGGRLCALPRHWRRLEPRRSRPACHGRASGHHPHRSLMWCGMGRSMCSWMVVGGAGPARGFRGS
jgi:hypothetical protein